MKLMRIRCSSLKRVMWSVASGPDLSAVQVHQAEREELQADGEAVEQPEAEGSERVGRHAVPEVEGEEQRAQSRPQQTQEQERRLVAEALVPVAQHQPQLSVDEGEQDGVEDGVGERQAQLDVGRDGGAESRRRQRGVRSLLTLHRG